MNKSFKYYAVIWTVLFAMFNLITFVVADQITGIDCLEGSFWVGFIFIVIAFLGQLGVGYSVFGAKNLQKTFYNLSLVRICWSALVTMFIVGTLCMVINLAVWFAVILCFVVLGFSIISLTKASAAAGIVEKIDETVKAKTFFIKSLTVDADTLVACAKSDAVKAECKKVYEAIRYSDPMSSDMLASVEGQITVKFAALSNAVAADDAAAVTAAANDMLILVQDRNNKCKLLK